MHGFDQDSELYLDGVRTLFNGSRKKELPTEFMPFFLVTHTSLVEAADEASAAEKAVGDIRRGGQLTVTVKADEQNVRQVTVVADDILRNICPDKTGCSDSDDKQRSSDDQAANRFDEHSSGRVRCGQRQLAGKLVSVGLFAAVSILVFVLVGHGEWSS